MPTQLTPIFSGSKLQGHLNFKKCPEQCYEVFFAKNYEFQGNDGKMILYCLLNHDNNDSRNFNGMPWFFLKSFISLHKLLSMIRFLVDCMIVRLKKIVVCRTYIHSQHILCIRNVMEYWNTSHL